MSRNRKMFLHCRGFRKYLKPIKWVLILYKITAKVVGVLTVLNHQTFK